MKKLYIIQKHVVAQSITEAMRLEKKIAPDGVFVDDDWKKANMPEVRNKKETGYKK